MRERLPKKRRSEKCKFKLGGFSVHTDVGFYPDGRPGEIFVNVSKTGSFTGTMIAAFAKVVSIALQYGAPPSVLCASVEQVAGGPDGRVECPEDGGPQIKEASSMPALIAKVLDWYATH